MATYVNDLRLKEIATGDESGTWGTSTNTNLELIAEAFSFGTEAITTNADTHTTTIADGSTDPGRSIYLKYTGTLDSACTITIGPNTVSKLWFIENGTSGSQNIIISQGSGANVTIPAGDVKAVYSDGAGSGAAIVDAFASLNVVDLKVEDDLTVTDDLIVNGDIDLEGSIDVNGTTNLDVVDIDGALTQDGGAVFNEDSADVDFRVESNGQTHALFVDGGLDNVGIGYSAAHTATNKGLVILTGDGNGGIQLNKEDGSNPSSGETLGSIAWKGSDSANSNAAAGASIVGIAAEDFSGSAEGTHLAFNVKPTGTGPGSAPTERMRIGSEGNLAIGTTTTTNDAKLIVVGSDGKHPAIKGSDGGANGFTLLADNYTTTESQINLGVGFSSSDLVLSRCVKPSDSAEKVFLSSQAQAACKPAAFVMSGDGDFRFYNTDTNATTAVDTAVSLSEKARINSSGTILVGKTSSGVSTVGAEIRNGSSNYSLTGTSSGHAVQLLNRTSDDGDLVEFRQDNTKFGSIASDGNDLILDVVGDIILDAAGDNWLFKKSGTTLLNIQKDSDNLEFISSISDGDMKFRGNDGGSTITALTLDISDAGKAFFNAGIAANDNSFITVVASNHTNGLFLINSQAGGFGSALSFQSERSDDNSIVTAARIRTEGANSWNSDSTTESHLIFETCNDNSLSEAMRIRNDGTVVIGTTTNQGVGGLTFGTSSNGINVTNNTTTGAGNGHEFYVFRRNSTQIGSIVMSNTDGVTYSTSSDARLKNVLGEAKGLEIVNKLNPVNFEWKESKKVQDGLIAQEVEELIPHAVHVNEAGYYSMDYSKLVTPLIKAIQEQQEQIDALQSEINILKGE